jgi:tetratricopeptide (TPR) repeat protein
VVRSIQVAGLLLALVLLFTTLAISQAPAYAGTPASLSSAQSDFKQGEFRKAVAAYSSLIEKNRTDALAHAGVVRSLLKLDEVDQAADAAGRALREIPQSALVLAIDGDVKFRRGRFADAEEQYRAALKLDERCARAWLGMGRIHAASSHRKESQDAFARAHELAPDDGDTLYYWAINQPYPVNVSELRKHMAQFRDDEEKERHEREYIDFLEAIAGRKVWIPAADVPRTEIKLQPVITRVQDGPRAFSLQTKLNDRATATVMLDTGASGLTISRKVAERAHAKKLSEHSLEGVGNSGPAKGYEAWVDKVTIGNLEFHDCHVHVSPRDNPDYDGLIGTDVFERYLVAIDLPAHKLRLEPLPEVSPSNKGPEQDTFTAFYRFGHIMLMPTSVGDTAHGLFALDTGSATNSMSPELARRVSTVRSSDIPVNGMSGSVKNVFTADQTVLQFSRFLQPHENIITFDLHSLSKDLGTEISGLIGFATLKKMKIIIDYRDGVVDFEYKP